MTGLLRDLIEATTALAATHLVERVEHGWYGAAGTLEKHAIYCQQCFRCGLHGQPIEHAYSCAVGQALRAAASVGDAIRYAASQRIDEAAVRRSVAELEDLIAEAAGIVPPSRSKLAASRSITPVSSRVEENFIAGPVRTIEYDVLNDECVGEGLHRSHEDAAAERDEVFGAGVDA